MGPGHLRLLLAFLSITRYGVALARAVGLENGNDNDSHDKKTLSVIEQVQLLTPPMATSIQGGDIENAEWWLEHEPLLQSAWNEWDEQQHSLSLPTLDEGLIDVHLRKLMDQTRAIPTLEHETKVVEAWEEVLHDSATTATTAEKSLHRVYRYPNFLTPEGIRKVRAHLDALSEAPIPKRRPNAMNRNGLLLDSTVPGGVAGDINLQQFVATLAHQYLAFLGRALFPEFAGSFLDDSNHYAFTIKYGDCSIPNASLPSKNDNGTSKINGTTTTDWELKTHSDASLYTLNINLNLPNEDYSGSSLYFVAPQESLSFNSTGNATQTATRNNYREIFFAPGTAILHRGMTKHGAKPLKTGQRNNLVIWVHGKEDGFVRTAPYVPSQRLSVRQRWSKNKFSGTIDGAFLVFPTENTSFGQTSAHESEL